MSKVTVYHCEYRGLFWIGIRRGFTGTNTEYEVIVWDDNWMNIPEL
jgi:hypothetical protein